MTTDSMARERVAVSGPAGSIGDAVGISAGAEAALADLSAVMEQAVARVQEKRTTVERMVAEPAAEQDNEERSAGLRAVR